MTKPSATRGPLPASPPPGSSLTSRRWNHAPSASRPSWIRSSSPMTTPARTAARTATSSPGCARGSMNSWSPSEIEIRMVKKPRPMTRLSCILAGIRRPMRRPMPVPSRTVTTLRIVPLRNTAVLWTVAFLVLVLSGACTVTTQPSASASPSAHPRGRCATSPSATRTRSALRSRRRHLAPAARGPPPREPRPVRQPGHQRLHQRGPHPPPAAADRLAPTGLRLGPHRRQRRRPGRAGGDLPHERAAHPR